MSRKQSIDHHPSVTSMKANHVKTRFSIVEEVYAIALIYWIGIQIKWCAFQVDYSSPISYTTSPILLACQHVEYFIASIGKAVYYLLRRCLSSVMSTLSCSLNYTLLYPPSETGVLDQSLVQFWLFSSDVGVGVIKIPQGILEK